MTHRENRNSAIARNLILLISSLMAAALITALWLHEKNPSPDDLPEPEGQLFPAWVPISEPATIPEIAGTGPQTQGAAAIDVRPLRQIQLTPGVTLELSIPQVDFLLTDKIEEVIETTDGIVTVKSFPDGSGNGYFLITIGQKNTFASLFTPFGNFTLVGNTRYGWLKPSEPLPNVDDAVISESRGEPKMPTRKQEPTL